MSRLPQPVRYRRLPIAVIAVGLALVSLVATTVAGVVRADTAAAHAVVVASSPADNARLPDPPTEVTIEFSEDVSIETGGLTVLDAAGQRVDEGSTRQPQPTTLQVSLQPDLPQGTYVANYRIVSADGHPISGAVVFGVGNAAISDVSGLAQKNDPMLDVFAKVVQFMTYLGALLAVGLAFFLAFVHDGGAEQGSLSRWSRSATVVALVGAVGTILVQAGLATGGSVTAAFDPSKLGPVLRQGLGLQSLALLLDLTLVYVSVGTRRAVVAQSLAFYGGVIAAASFVLWGHATESARPWLSIPADVLHVAVAAVWFGGLVGLTVVLQRRSSGGGLPPDPAAASDAPANDVGRSPSGTVRAGSFPATVHVVDRFSTAAAISVGVLVAAGLALAISEVGSLAALIDTRYGQVLLLKSALVSVVLFVAAYNRFFLLPWLTTDVTADAGHPDPIGPDTDTDVDRGAVEGPGAPEAQLELQEQRAGWRTLLHTVQFEGMLLVAVLMVTAILVNTTPGGTSPESEAFQESRPFRTGSVSLTITPNRPGSNSFHLDLIGPDGRPTDLAQKVTLELSLPAKQLGPIERPLVKAGTGHFLLENVNDLSITGEWTVTLVLRVSEFDQERIDFTDTIS